MVKRKVMCISKNESMRPLNIEIDGKKLEQVEKYTYLGVVITSDRRDNEEIRIRMEKLEMRSPIWNAY